MFSIFGYSTLIFIGCVTYIALGGKPSEDIKKKENKNYEEETYEYFLNLTLEDQERYFKENLDLKYYKDDLSKGLTNDRYLNAKHAREISRLTGKSFTNKNRVY